MIHNIIFDLGGVLIDLEPSRTLDAFQKLIASQDGQPISALDLMGGGESELMQLYQIGGLSTDAFFEQIETRCKAGTTRTQMEKAWDALLIGLPFQRLDMLRRLHEAGMRVYILSNTNEAHTRWVARHFASIGLVEGTHIDHAYYSNEIGLAKPDEACFRYVIEDAGIVPEDTLYIDDLAKNVEAGLRLGFQAIRAIGDEWLPIAEELIRKREIKI